MEEERMRSLKVSDMPMLSRPDLICFGEHNFPVMLSFSKSRDLIRRLQSMGSDLELWSS
jgi:hypothetical protein